MQAPEQDESPASAASEIQISDHIDMNIGKIIDALPEGTGPVLAEYLALETAAYRMHSTNPSSSQCVVQQIPSLLLQAISYRNDGTGQVVHEMSPEVLSQRILKGCGPGKSGLSGTAFHHELMSLARFQSILRRVGEPAAFYASYVVIAQAAVFKPTDDRLAACVKRKMVGNLRYGPASHQGYEAIVASLTDERNDQIPFAQVIVASEEKHCGVGF